jgi:ureidoacrylate peracid hydrolase
MFRRGRGRGRNVAPGVVTATDASRAAGSALDPDRVALLVIDPVNDFLSEGGAAWDVTKRVVEKHDVVGHLQEAIAGARARRVPVLFAPMAFTAADYGDGTLQTRSTVNRVMFERRMFLAGSWGADFHPDLRPEAEDIVVQPHKSMDVFETDLSQHLERLGVDHLVIAGMAANQCCESTGRHAMEHGYRVVYLRDAIGADNLAAYEAAIRLNLPLVSNAVLDVDEFLAALDHADAWPARGDVVQSSDHLKIGRVKQVVPPDAEHPGHLKLRKGVFVRRTFYAPLDGVMPIGLGRAVVSVPKLLIDKMPWDKPSAAAPGHVAQASTTAATE